MFTRGTLLRRCNQHLLNAHSQYLDIPSTRGNRRKFSRRRSRVCAQRLRTQLAFAGVLFFAGADVLVVAPTGMGKVSPVTPTFLLPASNPTRASAFKSPRSHKRFVSPLPIYVLAKNAESNLVWNHHRGLPFIRLTRSACSTFILIADDHRWKPS